VYLVLHLIIRLFTDAVQRALEGGEFPGIHRFHATCGWVRRRPRLRLR
jgi:hypothetical protein